METRLLKREAETAKRRIFLSLWSIVFGRIRDRVHKFPWHSRGSALRLIPRAKTLKVWTDKWGEAVGPQSSHSDRDRWIRTICGEAWGQEGRGTLLHMFKLGHCARLKKQLKPWISHQEKKRNIPNNMRHPFLVYFLFHTFMGHPCTIAHPINSAHLHITAHFVSLLFAH